MGQAKQQIAARPEGGALMSLMQQLALAREMDEVMRLVRTAARALSGADGVTFVLRDGDRCFYADEDAISPLWKGQRFPIETCISGWAMIHRQPVVIEDIYRDDRIPHDAYRLTFVKSLVMVPVRKEDPVAAIGAYWAEHHKAGPDEVALLESIANAAAVAITNVNLYLAIERRAAEAERQAAELARAKAALERANEQKSRFLAACSHDLRQPFQAMRLFHTLLAERSGGSDTVVQRLGEAMTQGEDLLHSLLDVSAIESGLTLPNRAAVSLDEVFQRVRATVTGQTVERGIELRVRACPYQVDSDPLLLARILANLATNAVKYTERGGVLIGARRRGGTVSVEVWDTGIGIAADQFQDIFEDFYQVGNPERDKRKGIGLGLGIVRRLADALGHPVTVRSRLGHGTVFAVTVPLAETRR